MPDTRKPTQKAPKKAPKKAPARPAAKKEQPARSPQTVVFTIDGKPRTIANRTFSLAFLAQNAIGGKGAAEKLRKELDKAGISDPSHTAWTLTLSNGREVGAILEADKAGLASARKGSPEPKASAPKGKGKKEQAPEAQPAGPSPKAKETVAALGEVTAIRHDPRFPAFRKALGPGVNLMRSAKLVESWTAWLAGGGPEAVVIDAAATEAAAS